MEVNPDTRPLPEGWAQHYEPSQHIWYYVQTNVIPPKVSSTHPLDGVPSNSRRKSKRVSNMSSLNLGLYSASTGMEMPQAGGVPTSSSMSMSMAMPHAPTNATVMPSPPQPRMSRAQELYASSASRIAVPMISTNDIQSFSTTPSPALQSAVSPLSSYPAVHGGRPLPGAPMSQLHAGQASLHSHLDHHAPHRTHSLQQIRPQHELHRAQTYAPGQNGLNTNPKQSNGPRTLTTKAAPPSELNRDVPPALKTNGQPAPSMSAPLSPLRLGSEISGSPLTTPSPPTSSMLFSSSPSSIGTPMSSPPMSPPISSPHSAPPFTTPHSISQQVNVAPNISSASIPPPPPPSKPTLVNNPAMFPPRPPQPTSTSISAMFPPQPPKPVSMSASAMYPPNANSANNNAGRQAVGAMFKLAGGIFAATTGSSSGIFNTVGNFVSNPAIFNTLTSAFSKNNTGVSDAELQAVMQAKPGANYQGVINALVQQQQAYQRQSAAYVQSHPGMAPPLPSVNYQALIAEVQRLQRLSQQQQQNQQVQPGLQPHQLQQLAQHQQSQHWVPRQPHQQQQAQHLLPQQPQQQAQQFVPQQQQAHFAVPQQQQQQHVQPQAVHTLPQQPQNSTQQQVPYAAQQQPQHNQMMHQQQGTQHTQAAPPQQQQQQQQPPPQNDQNCYMQALHTMQHLYHEMSDQQQQQQQQQQPDQQQPQQPSVTENYNLNYSLGGDNGSGQQQQQPSMTDIFNAVNPSLGVSGNTYDSSQPTFDPSTLYSGDPNNSGGGSSLLDALSQTLAGGNSGSGQTDGSGMVALLSGVNQALNPLNNFDQGGIDLGLGNNNNGW